MYYIAVSSIGKINIGEKVLLTDDREFDEISAIRPNGEVIGYVVSFDIDGCLNKNFLSRAISGDQGIICNVALKSGDIMILSSDGRYLPSFHEIESNITMVN